MTTETRLRRIEAALTPRYDAMTDDELLASAREILADVPDWRLLSPDDQAEFGRMIRESLND